ncbi:hypothetical protein ABPG72_006551 [Tetrahymena utriculariae]
MMIQDYHHNPALRKDYCKKIMKIPQIDNPTGQKQIPGIEGEGFKEIGAVHFMVTDNQYKICVHREPAQGDVKAVLILMHGYNGHMKRAQHIAKQLAQEGIEVIGYDQRGFGKSEGPRGYIESVEQMVNDFEEFYKQIIVEHYQYKQRGLPIFMGGLSLGGMLSYRVGLKYPDRFKGIIMMAPAIQPFPLQYKFIYYLAVTLGKIMPKGNFISTGAWNSNKYNEAEKCIKSDPLQYTQKPPFTSLSSVIQGLYNTKETFEQFKCPFLCIMGDLEKIVDPFLGFDLEKKSPSQDKTVKYYQQVWHNIWQEPEIYDINKDVIKWIQQRIN